ncbi:efflux transporter outer membrane subunit [Desulfopila sp. IMCC35008]|uniref:efflux transporter outer membrane subunit n=1 Tax=Desulfopila sp. IMCC35008 TaxID=2653858 RepID=UPI00197ABCDE|nr:efflux transporter outer membrane subunit [Desulfopila sp. IMCC35008]
MGKIIQVIKTLFPSMLIICMFGLNGCTKLGPDFTTPEAKIPKEWGDTDSRLFHKPSLEESLEWWKQFNDPVLDELILIAYRENLTLQSAGLRIVEARAQLATVKGNLYPQSQTMSGDLFTIGSTAPAADRYYNAALVGFDVGWEMDFWGKFRRSVESADANLLASIYDYDDVLVSLTAEVARSYVTIRTLQERIALAQKNTELQQNTLQLVILQFEAGVVTELDVLQAKTLLSSTLATIPNLQAALSTYKNSLAVLLGKLPEEIEPDLQTGGAIPEMGSSIAMAMPAELLRRRPDVRRAEMQAAAQSAQIGISRSELFPSFTLFGSVGWSATDIGENSLGDIFDSNSFSYSFGPAFTWNVLNYGRLKNQVRVQDARYQQTILNYQNSVLNAAREVEDAIQTFSRTFQEAELVRQAVATSKKSTELSLLQYEEGLADYLRVLDSTRSLTLREDQYAQIKGQIATSAIGLYKAFGGGWKTYLKQPYLPAITREQMSQRTDWGGLLPTSEKPGGEE